MRSGTIAFLAGITAFQQLTQLPGAAWSWCFYATVFGLLLLSRRQCLFLIPLFVCIGFSYAWIHAKFLASEPLPKHLEGEDVILEGVIVNLPEKRGRRIRFEFLPESVHWQGKEQDLPGRLRLNWYEKQPPDLEAGQRWRLTARLKRAHGMINPGTFDYEAWLYQRGIRTTGYVRQDQGNRLLGNDLTNMPLQRLRQHLRESLVRVLGDEEAAGLIVALAIGERDSISDEQWRLLTQSGTNHLMAISGLHIGMIAGLFYFLAGRLWRLRSANLLWLPAPKVAAFSAIIGAVIYAALAGFSIPTRRALIMVLVVMGAVLFQRATRPSRVLALALLLVLLLDPLAVLSPGFWLSFAAVGIILYGMGGREGKRGTLGQLGRVQFLVGLGLLPLVSHFFHQAAVAGPVANLIAVPWIGMVVVPPTLLGTILELFVPGLATLLLLLAAKATTLLLSLLSWCVALLPPVILASPPSWAYLLITLGIALLFAPRGWPARWLGGVLILPLFLLRDEIPPGAYRFTLLDVGQGLAAAVQTRNHILIYDTGARYASGFDIGRAVIVPWLRNRGIAKIDTLVISHGDNDHIGGARSLLSLYPTDRVLTSVPHKMTWTGSEECHAGQKWQWDGIGFEILHPFDAESNTKRRSRGNNGSCVLRVSGEGGSVLLPGDIEAAAEQELLIRYRDKLASTVLVAPHHGSKTSSTRPFVEAVHPRWVLFPVGYRNRYRFPHEQVVERYLDINTTSIDSVTSGAITFSFDPQHLVPAIERCRVKAHRYWYQD